MRPSGDSGYHTGITCDAKKDDTDAESSPEKSLADSHGIQQTRQGARLRKLIEANQMLAQVESLPELLPRLLRLAQDVTSATASSILLFNANTQKLHFALAMNNNDAVADTIMQNGIELDLGEGIAGLVAAERKPVIIQDATKDSRVSRKTDDLSGFVTRSLLCVPVVYKDDLLGVAQVLNPSDRGQFTEEDLEILESFAHLAGVALVRSRLLEALLEQERFTAQLEAASNIQKTFYPVLPQLPNGSHIWAASEPAIHVGGDMYDCQRMPDGSIIAYVADVAGKGLPAALIGATVWARMRSAAVQDESVSSLLTSLNKALIDDMDTALFTTLILLRYWPETGKGILANAGHPEPVFIRQGKHHPIKVETGMPLGIERNVEYSEYPFVLEPNDTILLVTDGISEARNKTREFFGDDRVIKSITQCNMPPCGKKLLDSVTKWQSDCPANDDKTILEIWRT